MPYTSEHKSKSKERILESATRLFCRYGFSKVSINQVMKKARLTHGAFYAHFESKESLYRASFMETLRQSSTRRLAKAPLSIQHLTQLVDNLLNLRSFSDQAEPSVENILFTEVNSESLEIKQLYERSYRNVLRMLETRLSALAKLKKLYIETEPSAIAENIAEKSRSILATMVGAVLISKSITDEEEINRLLTAAQNQVLRSLGVSELTSNLSTSVN
jgi:TetR/AcrR family transcriptional repressor of nem operon